MHTQAQSAADLKQLKEKFDSQITGNTKVVEAKKLDFGTQVKGIDKKDAEAKTSLSKAEAVKERIISMVIERISNFDDDDN